MAVDKVVVDPGFRPIPDMPSTPLNHINDRMFVARGSHLVGSRDWRGGRLFVMLTPDGQAQFDLHQAVIRYGDAVYSILFVIDEDGVVPVDGDDVPAPFDRFKVGGERLSDHRSP